MEDKVRWHGWRNLYCNADQQEARNIDQMNAINIFSQTILPSAAKIM